MRTDNNSDYRHQSESSSVSPSIVMVRYMNILDRKFFNLRVKLIKREELGIKYRQMYWLPGRRSTLSLRNKLVLYTQILKPVWTYGIQLWGCAAQSTIAVI